MRAGLLAALLAVLLVVSLAVLLVVLLVALLRVRALPVALDAVFCAVSFSTLLMAD